MQQSRGWGAHQGCLRGREGLPCPRQTQAVSCFFPPVSVQQSVQPARREGPCLALAGRLPGRQRGEIQRSQCSRCCSLRPATQAPVRVDVCVTPRGQACPEPECLTKSTFSLSSGGFGSDGWQALKGGAPDQGPKATGKCSFLVACWGEGRGGKWHLCPPPGDIPGHHPGPGSPVAKWPLSGSERMSGRFILCLSCLSTDGWGWGLVLTVCPPAAVYCPPFLVLRILAFLPEPWRTLLPLPGVLPGAVRHEAEALGSGLAGLARNP